MKVDVVVIGAGLGGLACAADLAGRGAHVALLERHSELGGYASGFERGPYRFDVSQHCVGGLAKGESFHLLLSRLGIADAVRLEAPERTAVISTPSLRLELPNGREERFEALASAFPDERDALSRLIRECTSIHRDTVAGALDGDMRRLVRGMRLAGTRTFEAALGPAIGSPELRSVLSMPWSLIGLPPSRASHSWFAKVISTTFVEEARHIVGGGRALAASMAARARSLGAEIITGDGARRVVLSGGRTAGVEAQSGLAIETRAVVAGLDPWSLASLLNAGDGPGLEPSGEPSLSMIAVYLGMRGDPESLSIPAGTTFSSGTGDAERAYRASLRGAVGETDLVITNPTRLDPACAPDGKGMIHAVTLVNGRPWFDLDGAAYAKRKREATRTILDRLESMFPGIGGAIEVQETATPRTMYGYTRNHMGAVYGLAQTVAQSGAQRPSAATAIPGLYRTGAWVLPGGGYSASTLSGLMTSRETARFLGLDRAAGRARADRPEDGDTFRLRIYYEDTDRDGITYHVSYLRFFDRARTEMTQRLASARGFNLPRAVVSRIEVAYQKPSTLGDELEIRSRGRFESDWRVTFDQEAVLVRDGTPLATASVTLVFVDEDGNPAPTPLRAAFEAR